MLDKLRKRTSSPTSLESSPIMRLLELNDGGFSLTSHQCDNIPPYATLSHTWGSETEEVTFADLMDGTGESKAGYNKIRFCGEQAMQHGIQYVWVDTCCIDKSNNTELTTAINSMFRWYQKAARCYVYLSDVSLRTQDGQSYHVEWESSLRNSRWFRRGWTLQELLAPNIVEFYSRECIRLGDKRSLQQQISQITGIAIEALQGRPLSDYSFEERLIWAKNRQTFKEEDMAYCLLGIFSIHLPLIYGEGLSSAMRRLRKEIRDVTQNEPHSPSKALTTHVGALSAPSYDQNRLVQSRTHDQKQSRPKKEDTATEVTNQIGSRYKPRHKISKQRLHKGRGSSSREEQISRGLSKLLRHTAEAEGVRMRPDGYVNLYDVINAPSIKFLEVTLSELRNVVTNSDKQRFSLVPIASKLETAARPTANASGVEKNDPRRFLIRANRGHSVEVDLTEIC